MNSAAPLLGAADAFTGGLTTGLAMGLPLRYAAVWGMSAAAFSLRASGGQDSMAKEAEMRAFLHVIV
jgi:sugar/nucleoside kinase (ribokinase family)